jgi:hypothetical protein
MSAAPTPEQVQTLTAAVYRRLGPQLGTHVQCRLVACIAEAWSVPATMELFIPDYVDGDGTTTPHFRVLFEDGRVLDSWRGKVRQRAGRIVGPRPHPARHRCKPVQR